MYKANKLQRFFRHLRENTHMFLFDSKRLSEKNGVITIRRGFSGPNVIVDGYSQTGEGLNAIWRDALIRALPHVAPEPKVLVLGLGGGGVVRVLYQLAMGTQITAIEHDPEMINIAHELKYHEPFPEPEIILGDAQCALEGTRKRFDLIVIDIFRGGDPSPHLLEQDFWDAVKKAMKPGAIVLVNVAGSREFLESIAQEFTHADLWRCESNYLGMFSV